MSKLHFERLPKEKHKEVIELVREGMKKQLLEIHDNYKLTDFNYGCCNLSGMMIHYQRQISEGNIN